MKTTVSLLTRKSTRALAGSIAALLAVQAAQAAVVYWDADGSATSNSSGRADAPRVGIAPGGFIDIYHMQRLPPYRDIPHFLR